MISMKLTKAQTTEIVWFKINGKLNTRILNIKHDIYKRQFTTVPINNNKNNKMLQELETKKVFVQILQNVIPGHSNHYFVVFKD